jgi:hypothetical protein
MKKVAVALFCVAALSLATAAHAQMGMDLFKKPSITKAFHPVVGKGSQYETTKPGENKTRTMELSIVGKESVDGKDGYWMEMFMTDSKGQNIVAKSLVSVGPDFQFHKMILQLPSQGAMEMPMNMSAASRSKVQDSVSDWHSVGTETITVPAGTFSCDHWKNDKDGGDIWTSDKVTPFGMVKEVRPNSNMVLVKVLDDVQDRITGPVKPFDMQQMMQQMQQKP